VYGALVPASRFIPENGPDNKKQSLGRANAAKFIERLCKYPGNPDVVKEAQQHILEAQAEQLTRETGKKVTVEDIEESKAPRPKVLDMFAGGGAIPLEALRLGCEAYALDLNPVAHIIELCTLVYPQKYGKADPNAKGMTGNNGTWGGLANEVRYWGEWVLKKVEAEIGDLYPPIPDPKAPKSKIILGKAQTELAGKGFEKLGQQELSSDIRDGFLTPVAYLWTRTVRCKNPSCGATVPLVKQTWLCKKKGQNIAMRVIAANGAKHVVFKVVQAATEKALGFDPSVGSKGGNATCPFCGTVADTNYVKEEGWSGRMSRQMMAIICIRPGTRGKIYLSAEDARSFIPDDASILDRMEHLCQQRNLTIPRAPIANLPVDCRDNSLGITVRPYGIRTWADLFCPRQMLSLLTFCAYVQVAEKEMLGKGCSEDRTKAVVTLLGCVLDKQADFNSQLCVLKSGGGRGIVHAFGRQVITMVWDFAEANPFNSIIACWSGCLHEVIENIKSLEGGSFALVQRGSATDLPWPDASFEAVITDPPYYDNVPYSDISDYFYVWLKRSIGHLYTEHFASETTPKKKEAIADAGRYGGNKRKAKQAYEDMMRQTFSEANRVLKQGGQMTVVYAHKTTLGWATLVDALRSAGFIVTEAWPMETETSGRLRAQESAALASSIFLIARKREGSLTGSYEDEVRPELEKIVRERVDTLWKMGITGADLVIAAVGAGMKAFTQYARVELPNGDEVAPEKFLSEVEGVVQDVILEHLFGSRSSISAVDPATRFYVLWRHAYGRTEVDAGEAIVFSYPLGVELDGPQGLSTGSLALLERKGKKYRLKDFTERGDEERLGIDPRFGADKAPLVDVLHRLVWLVDNRRMKVTQFLDTATPDGERLRLVAQALCGAALEGSGTLITTDQEHGALKKLVSNWSSFFKADLMRK
jgi:putative DNA methylase